MKYKVCKQADIADLKRYLYENKKEIIPSAIEQMYANEDAVNMRLEHNMELTIMAINEENEIEGVISAISPNMDSNWTIVALHVLEKARRKKVATMLLYCLKENLVDKKGTVKCVVSIMNSNKIAGACFLINKFEYEGRLSAVEKENEMAVLGAVFCK